MVNTTLKLAILIVSIAAAVVIVVASFTLTHSPSPIPPLSPSQPSTGQSLNLNQTQNIKKSTNGSSIQSSSEVPTTIEVTSTNTAFPFVQRWAAQYENQEDNSLREVNVIYLEESQIAEMNDSDASRLAILGIPHQNNDTYIPVSAQAVAIVYNIPGFPDIPSGLKLTPSTLLQILNGTITQWNDTAIKNLNPSLNLPAERIVVVHTSSNNNNEDSSSSLTLLDQYLGTHDINWTADSIPAQGPADLAETVRRTPFSLGYVDYSYAVQTRMTYAQLEGTGGNFVIPSMDSIGRAVDSALEFQNSSSDQSLSQEPPIINTSRLVNGSYPITGLYYTALKPSINNNEVTALAISFVNWTISVDGGQQTLLEVQYPPIYLGNQQLATFAKTSLDAISNKLTK
jgi:ABC-type phosphate transport system substrate-binding protein